MKGNNVQIVDPCIDGKRKINCTQIEDTLKKRKLEANQFGILPNEMHAHIMSFLDRKVSSLMSSR